MGSEAKDRPEPERTSDEQGAARNKRDRPEIRNWYETTDRRNKAETRAR